MSKAEKMFNELGYIIDNTQKFDGIYYLKENDLSANEYWFLSNNLYVFSFLNETKISPQDLQAITQQMKELGWL